MHDVIQPSVKLTNAAVNKIKYFIRTNKIQHQRAVDIKLRVYIIGGGCGGFQYGFILDDQVSNDDCIIENSGASVVIDPMSMQYLFGGIIDYHEGLEGSKFIVINPNAKMTCSCGSSFSV